MCNEGAATAQFDTTHCAPTAERVQRRRAAGRTLIAPIVGNRAGAFTTAGSTNDATYVTVPALLARCAQVCLDAAPIGIKPCTLEPGRISTYETRLAQAQRNRCRWRGSRDLQQGPTSVDVATEKRRRPIGMCAKGSDGQLTALTSRGRGRRVEGGATPAGPGPPAARSDISRCGDKTAAAAAKCANLPDSRGPPPSPPPPPF